jgi:Protein of unknown function (DUF3987)/Primase C terminal 2 (PriCT-2)/VirE N-terminal domain
MSALEALTSLFQGAHTQHPWETAVPLVKVLESIKRGDYGEDIEAVRRLKGKKQAIRAAKEKLLAFTPGCCLSTRDKDVPWADKLISTTNIVHYDFDNVSDPAALKHTLSRSPSLVFAFISPSGDGLKVGIAAAGITDTTSYNHAWVYVLGRLKTRYPEHHIAEDKHVKFLHALCFFSADPDLYMNPEAVALDVPPAPPPSEAETPHDAADAGTVDYATVASALPFVPGYDDYSPWLETGMALHATAQPWAKPAWDGWSAQSPKFDPKAQQRKWQSFSRERDHQHHIGQVLKVAYQHGWRQYTANGTTPPDEDAPLPQAYPWPTLAQDARHGLAGEIVTTLEPHTESDPVALLVQLLAMAGNCIGRAPYFTVEATRHYLNMFVALVGKSSRSRKGTSADHIARLLDAIDATWSPRVVGGLSSGEGVIYHVRDAVYGQNRKGEDVCLDNGVDDKRLCVLETEFARALTKTGQEGNVLSAVLRQAWDSGNLRTLVSGRQKAPTTASNAHVSLCTHITAEELCRLLTDTEAANGFGNRFLWACVQRSKLLPSGGQYPHQALVPLIERLRQAVEFARQVAEMHRTPAAEPRWRDIYTALAEEQPGLLGALTARAEAQVLRLACLYALLDQTAMVDVPHLNAAYALWRYCAHSARFVFGDRLGDHLADDLLAMLRTAGANRAMTLFTSLGPSADCRGPTQITTYQGRTDNARVDAFSVSRRGSSLG